ncbi:TetR/AcrR family transcriptional regulator [Microbacterium trichothecenolyticum]
MPKLWSETIAEHRSVVFDAILDATAELVHRHGPTGVTMTALAESSGVGRATLYRYVPDVASALSAWQHREVSRHLQRLRAIAAETAAETRLDAVLAGYARIRSHRHGDDGAMHEASRLAPAEAELRELVKEIITDDAQAGRARTDLSSEELAAYAIASLGATALLPAPSSALRLSRLVVGTIRGESAP